MSLKLKFFMLKSAFSYKVPICNMNTAGFLWKNTEEGAWNYEDFKKQIILFYRCCCYGLCYSFFGYRYDDNKHLCEGRGKHPFF